MLDNLRALRPLSISAFAVLAACGTQLPLSAPGPSAQNSSVSQSERRGSWMLPQAKHQDLLYVADQRSNKVLVYSHPKGTLVGTLTGFTQPGGECVDPSGDVFITNFGGASIVEYQHGGTQAIATLEDAGAYPFGCAFDPTTGNLAVTNYFGPYGRYSYGDLALYAGARGTPTTYTDSSIYWYGYCAYDGKGNLYIDGYSIYSSFQVAEMPKRERILKDISIENAGTSAGSLQWNGKYLAIADDRGFGEGQRGPQTIDLVRRVGSRGTIVKTLTLDVAPFANAGTNVQFWIANDSVIMPYAQRIGYSPILVGSWRYPAGGQSISTISGFQYAMGVTLSPRYSSVARWSK